jgi:hypothetical protein
MGAFYRSPLVTQLTPQQDQAWRVVRKLVALGSCSRICVGDTVLIFHPSHPSEAVRVLLLFAHGDDLASGSTSHAFFSDRSW